MDHSHRYFHELGKRADSVTTEDGTVYSVVYVTASPTFTGVIGGYTTLSDGGDDTTAAATATSGNAEAAETASVEYSTAPAETISAATFSDNLGTTTSATSNTVVDASPTTTYSRNNVAETSSSASATNRSTAASSSSSTTAASSNNTSSSSSSSSSGMSTGAKAGIAIGVIALIGLLAVLLLWFLGKKRKQREAETNKDNEKSAYDTGAAATEMVDRSPTAASHTPAPRLSLRPISHTMGALLAAGAMASNNQSRPAQARNMSPSPQPRGPSPAPKVSEERQDPFADPQMNPFADPEKSVMAPTPIAVPAPVAKPAPIAPVVAPMVGDASTTAAVTRKPIPVSKSEEAAPATGTASTPEATTAPLSTYNLVTEPALAASNSPENVSEDASKAAPSSAEAATPTAVVAPASESPQGNVYRVMMDFAPSMEDELELKSGQLVRMLHEYDDGWALCIRLDRSQQGVVPRTCLAAKPSKPKPSHLNQYARPSAPGPNAPPMSPAGGPRNFSAPRPVGAPGRPISPAGHSRSTSAAGPQMPPAARSMSPARAMSPGPGHFNQAPRPLSPGPRPQQKRSMSPTPSRSTPMADVSRRRSNSASIVREKRNSPVGPSKLGPGASAPGTAL
ncbi:hypothetical protein PV11_05099 [Exophiala sideris]|uniref:SH3 domain-containing protein n=1 Tax=Exophiala sideris TaxID=1016849 RepID=A0A0D1YPA9_9EURO|nr:hypothetical protein PV11_05099 [Exophiala sideris]